MEQVEVAVCIDEQLDLRPDRIAHRGNARRVLLDHVVQGALIAPAQRLVSDRHLQAREALRDPMPRGRGELRAIEEAKAERRVDRYAFARAAEQAPHRLPERLALDVPQRKVDRRDRVRGVAGLPARHRLPVKLLPDRPFPQRLAMEAVIKLLMA